MDAIFFVDGFNLYHSIKDLHNQYGMCYKWLDLYALCKNITSKIRNKYNSFININKIHYFTAYAYHRGNEAVNRHKLLIECYKDKGIIIHISKFKKKQITCPYCNQKINRREEKETDVALAVKLLTEASCIDQKVLFILLTGDTDLKPALHEITNTYNNIDLWIAFPYNRRNTELENIASQNSIQIKQTDYSNCQLPNPYVTSKGKKIHKPKSW